MYFQFFGSSALLHLLAAHPRVVGVLGIAATVGMLFAPQGPGRLVGSASYLEQVDVVMTSRVPSSRALEAKATRDMELMLDVARREEINAAVAHVLRECGSGCTDLTTPVVSSDPRLLRRVLTLYHLDKAAAAGRAATANAVAGGGSDHDASDRR